jgi:glycine hydroxymethyltransferase
MKTIAELTQAELIRHKNTLNLIASENYPSPKVLGLLGSAWSLKYAEGYPGKRYYAGNENTDQLETYVQELALKVFDPTGEYGVNVQTLSGSPANLLVYFTVLEPQDTVLKLSLADGGHLSHLHSTSPLRKIYNYVDYSVKDIGNHTFEIDLADFENKLIEHKPKLTIIGYSAYPRQYDAQKLCEIAHKHGSLVLADVAHINGLIATGHHPTPFATGSAGADFISMTTHKTLRGPRSAMVFAKQDLMKQFNKTVFPGCSGGPHMNKIAALGQALEEVLGMQQYPDGKSFSDYSQAVIDNCKALELSLSKKLEIISPTQNHLCLVKLPEESDSLVIQQKLEEVGIITNRNGIPHDTKLAWRPSGMRFGTAALTSRGLTTMQASEIGNTILDCIFEQNSTQELKSRVNNIIKYLNWFY